MVTNKVRLANEAWEALYRAQATVFRELSAGLSAVDQLLDNEYSVLYALSVAPHGLRMTELGEDVLITQTGMSRLVARMEARGLVERADDPEDRRACRIRLTAAGGQLQRRFGAAHARHVAEVMNRALTVAQLETLRDLSRALVDDSHDQRNSRRTTSVTTAPPTPALIRKQS